MELTNPVRATLVLVAVPLALFKIRPRVRTLRFNLEEFAKSDFFKLFDFWKLLESAIGGRRNDGTDANPIMPKMTSEREASLPMADPVWVNLNKELWTSKDNMKAMACKIEDLELENTQLRDNLAYLEMLLNAQSKPDVSMRDASARMDGTPSQGAQ